MGKIVVHIKQLFFEMLPPFLFFLVMFNLVIITRVMTLKQYGIPVRTSAIAVIAALIVAKVVLLANRIPFLNLYPRKPLVYNVLLKTIIYSLATTLFIAVERFFHLATDYGNFAAARAHIADDPIWSMFWLKQLWVFVLILFYCAGAELTRVVGREKVREIFFGIKSKVK